ncbi:TPA: hypothetical protein VDB83_001205 [Burkholderia cenocepacia]|uniref:hypothetical protein n=1 Tax=Burkholderia cenocepacia TaxID=95486 RepID=UPI001B94E99E|nr:hypothetical protein [Burkholderia cenocepacia]MBR8096365.1 hypothetical protein [Burkholderia cenocepacia]HEP6426934.1 hypothetical protein [Burkholderia cenocepacia]
MREINTGGPAFPNPALADENFHPQCDVSGMTLRDYFAAEELSKVNCVEVCDEQGAYDRLAVHCYRMADAMLRAREGL